MIAARINTEAASPRATGPERGGVVAVAESAGSSPTRGGGSDGALTAPASIFTGLGARVPERPNGEGVGLRPIVAAAAPPSTGGLRVYREGPLVVIEQGDEEVAVALEKIGVFLREVRRAARARACAAPGCPGKAVRNRLCRKHYDAAAGRVKYSAGSGRRRRAAS